MPELRPMREDDVPAAHELNAETFEDIQQGSTFYATMQIQLASKPRLPERPQSSYDLRPLTSGGGGLPLSEQGY